LFLAKSESTGSPLTSLHDIPVATVPSESRLGSNRVELLTPRSADPLLRQFLTRFVPERERWHRYPLDAKGSRIWRLIDGRRTVAEVIAAYRRANPEDDAQVAGRIYSFLQLLQDHGFIHVKRR